MAIQGDRREYYEKVPPKWQTLLIAAATLVLICFFIPLNSWTFYLGIGMCLLLALLTLTHKKSIKPQLTIDRNIIKTTYGERFAIHSVTHVELVIKGKWSRYKSHYIKLFFSGRSSTEFPIDRLDADPRDIFSVLKAIIDEQKRSASS